MCSLPETTPPEHKVVAVSGLTPPRPFRWLPYLGARHAIPRALAARAPYVDVVGAMDEQPRNRAIALKVVTGPSTDAGSVESDPFAEVEV